MLEPVRGILNSLLDQGIALVPILAALACLFWGGYMLIGSHAKGREGLIFVFIGTAIMLGSKTIAAGIHP